MIEKYKIKKKKNEKNQTSIGIKPKISKNKFETPLKNEFKKEYQKPERIKIPIRNIETDQNNQNLEIDHLAKVMHKKKFIVKSK